MAGDVPGDARNCSTGSRVGNFLGLAQGQAPLADGAAIKQPRGSCETLDSRRPAIAHPTLAFV